MNSICQICSSSSHFLMKKDGYDLYRCPSCSLVFVYPQPSLEYLRKNIYSKESGFQSNRAEDLSKFKPNKRYGVMYNLLEKVKPCAEILDVGAGGGHFLYGAIKRGFSGAGVELNSRTAESAQSQGLTIFTGTLAEAISKIGSKRFDGVVLGEIIEHVNNPKELIELSSKVIHPNGFLLITTPNLDCFWSRITFKLWKLFGIPWSSVTPPYHLFQFSSKNLDLLLEKAGFQVIVESYAGVPPLKYELGMLHMLKEYKRTGDFLDLLRAIFAYGIYSILYVVNYIFTPFLSKNFNMLKVYSLKK